MEMKLLVVIYLKVKRMKLNWKRLLLSLIKFVEMIVAGAAGGTIGTNL